MCPESSRKKAQPIPVSEGQDQALRRMAGVARDAAGVGMLGSALADAGAELLQDLAEAVLP